MYSLENTKNCKQFLQNIRSSLSLSQINIHYFEVLFCREENSSNSQAINFSMNTSKWTHKQKILNNL